MTDSKEKKQLVFVGNEVVVQDNRLIESPRNLTLQEFKLFMLLVSKVNPETDTDFSTFRIDVSEFAKALNLEQLDYNEFKKIVRRLMKRTIEIRRPKVKHDTEFPLLSKADYFYGKGYAELRINDELKPYLLNLKQQFTVYKISQVLTLSSVFAIRLYELMKQYEKFGIHTISIDELRKSLKLNEFCYSKVSNLRDKVLEIAQREINQKTDLTISYSFQKDSRKFSDVIFEIRSKIPKSKKEEILEQKFYFFRAEENPENIEFLKSFGYTDLQAIKLLEFRNDEDVRLAFAAVQEQIQKNEPQNIKAFIRTALNKKWKPNNMEIPKSVRGKKTVKETTEAYIEYIQSDQIETDQTRKSGFSKFRDLLSDLSNLWRNKNGKK